MTNNIDDMSYDSPTIPTIPKDDGAEPEPLPLNLSTGSAPVPRISVFDKSNGV